MTNKAIPDTNQRKSRSDPLTQGGTPAGLGPGVKLDRKESYKAQRKNYRKEKKRVGKELLSTFQDETIIVLADWLKVIMQLNKTNKNIVCFRFVDR